ncbi:hypothetical protein AL543_09310 [Vibrio mimicus]|nr:hypothetical protein AL543_09310 [Vibrio mimicus]
MLAYLQKIGKSLMLPIAALPIAGILMRMGQPDLLDIAFITAAGTAIFDNLPLIFSLGIAVGLSFDGAGAAAIAGAISYFTLVNGASSINSDINMSVFAGVIAGITAGELYNRFYKTDLPEWLAFFSGRRLVLILSGLVSIFLAFIAGNVWPAIQSCIDHFSSMITSLGSWGAGIYGFINRLLIPLGLHHVVNSFFWFGLGDFTDVTGKIVHGDLTRFFALDPAAGTYMTGFFPFLMFGYPAAALAMYVTAKPENKKKVMGMYLSIGLTAFVTGIGEPIDFIYMFLSPPLYIIHSILVAMSMIITDLLGMKLGFTFSAGVIDYLMNYNIATKPLLLMPVGITMGLLYFIIFRWFIINYDLKTPGREEESTPENCKLERNELALLIIEKLGGENNIIEIGCCATRLRVKLRTRVEINQNDIKLLGASGAIPVSGGYQIVFGPQVETIKDLVVSQLKTQVKK